MLFNKNEEQTHSIKVLRNQIKRMCIILNGLGLYKTVVN
jgi:hypothetical protein